MLARGPDTAVLRFGLGKACLAKGQQAEAIAHLRQALVLDPSYSAAWQALAEVLAASGQTREAQRVLERGIDTAGQRGDMQAARVMQVMLKRILAQRQGS